MISRRLLILATVAVAAAAGCSYGGEDETESGASDTGASLQTRDTTTPPSVSPVTPAAKEAISDWYEDGVFDRDHSCGAIETALAAIPVSLERYEYVVPAFRDYRTSVC
jgi:hypothetical protein